MSDTLTLGLSPGEDVLALDDEQLIAASKPSGEPVIAARSEPPAACLQRRLERALGRRLFVVHRIDRDASGVVLFATSASSHRALNIAFEQRLVTKTYEAFTAGTLTPATGRIEVPLHDARKGKTRPARPGEPGQSAVTEYTTRAVWPLGPGQLSLVEIHPLTGRHHQIRVHLRWAEAPILFDPHYARGRTPAALGEAPCARLALHALRIDVPAPSGRGRLVIEAPLAPDLVALRAWLDEHAI